MGITRLQRDSSLESKDSRLDAWRERPLEVIRHATSEALGWGRPDAALLEVAGASVEPIVLGEHSVSMLVGPPLETAISCDDATVSRLQRPGTFDFFPAHSSLSFVDAGSSLFLRVSLDRSLVCETAHSMGLDIDRITFRPDLTCRDERIEHLLWALKVELDDNQPGGRVFAESVAVALVSQLLRRNGVTMDLRRTSAGLPELTLRRVLGHIENNLATDLTLSEVARVANLGLSQFCALFKASVGTSVHRYVVRRRVERAVNLITSSWTPLSDVALQTGFANQSHMTAAVRRLIGTTPKRLRQRKP